MRQDFIKFSVSIRLKGPVARAHRGLAPLCRANGIVMSESSPSDRSAPKLSLLAIFSSPFRPLFSVWLWAGVALSSEAQSPLCKLFSAWSRGCTLGVSLDSSFCWPGTLRSVSSGILLFDYHHFFGLFWSSANMKTYGSWCLAGSTIDGKPDIGRRLLLWPSNYPSVVVCCFDSRPRFHTVYLFGDGLILWPSWVIQECATKLRAIEGPSAAPGSRTGSSGPRSRTTTRRGWLCYGKYGDGRRPPTQLCPLARYLASAVPVHRRPAIR